VIVEHVSHFLNAPDSESFDELALAAFAWQVEHVEPYRRLCERRGVSPQTVTDWRQVPLVPTAAYKTLTLAAAPGPNRIPMTLKTQMYIGERWELVFVKDALSVRAYSAAPLDRETCHVEFPPEALWIF